MTQAEFKAWFDGFTEGFDGKAPTAKQWDRIKKRVKEIDGSMTTQQIFVDRYWPPYRHWSYPSFTTLCAATGGVGTSNTVASSANLVSLKADGGSMSFAMQDLGRAEAASLS